MWHGLKEVQRPGHHKLQLLLFREWKYSSYTEDVAILGTFCRRISWNDHREEYLEMKQTQWALPVLCMQQEISSDYVSRMKSQ